VFRLDAAGLVDLPRPEGDPLRAAALPPLPPLTLPLRGGGLLGAPLPRLVGLDLLLPAILAAERDVAPAHPRARARTDQQPERRLLANFHPNVLVFDSYLYMKMSLFPPRCRRHRKQASR
jgi:hypothetical protein